MGFGGLGGFKGVGAYGVGLKALLRGLGLRSLGLGFRAPLIGLGFMVLGVGFTVVEIVYSSGCRRS